ncbi:hypothetical protein KP509_04G070200 [Ceratopteris richardii]|uniref:Uncharacterized protein n=1 Tax=Ceratopteris richardii TaxID=49495 RepID=A0A8T2UTV0_CERRI|nr:hypothetical protein KP509_04G070200 [Ceratopteris richardii]
MVHHADVHLRFEMEILAALCLHLALMAAFPSTASTPDLPRTEPEELHAVYEIMSATGNEWASRIPDVCRTRWHGIKCSQPDANNTLHVTELSFGVLSDDTAFPACTNMEMAYISPAIARLPYLRRLFFYKCCISNPKPIPAEDIAKLGGSLEVLVLRQNGHTGAISARMLASLVNLHTLDLHGNSLSSSIPPSIGFLQNLVLLDLSHNHLFHELPRLLSTLHSLRVLDLSFNRLQGLLTDDDISKFSNLYKLDLSHNMLSGSLPSVGFTHLQNLQLLDLSFNSFSGPLPPHLGLMASLQALLLNNIGRLRSGIPVTLRHLSQLETLAITSVGLVGEIPDIFYGMDKLKVVRMDDNELTGLIPKSLGSLQQLVELNLSNNRLIGGLPFSEDVTRRLHGRLNINNNAGLCFHRNSQHSPVILEGTHACTGMSGGPVILAEKIKGFHSSISNPREFVAQSNLFSSSPFLDSSSTNRHDAPFLVLSRVCILVVLVDLVSF